MLASAFQALVGERELAAVSKADLRAALAPAPAIDDHDHFDKDEDDDVYPNEDLPAAVPAAPSHACGRLPT
jgi:hypothetical protein